ncbi:hypothetical protein J2S43_007037 [Catenuloplanes nepalensis]|uniref:Glycosyltransferase RgtA/B/C/D-like domain-containing protein n=1 Tax=Catenuloplanes nepalensis TaxID=587533 RepID=A0ABT9N4P4_9ACTN|nr:hypothetical protein [Catenuloplanes nepalensis]MDP9798525.1 hypothetical protein [Catenuloplanes nepalensis]
MSTEKPQLTGDGQGGAKAKAGPASVPDQAPGTAITAPAAETGDPPAAERTSAGAETGARSATTALRSAAPSETTAPATPSKPAAGRPGEMTVAKDPNRDPFESFGPPPPVQLSPVGRVVAAVRRGLTHEWTFAILGGLLFAVVMTWPTLRYPLHTIPQDIWDPTLQAWQMAWSGHILLTDPAQLWESNTFYPNELSFAFSDALIGYAPAGMIGEGPVAAVLRYNIIFVLAYAMVFVGGYALARQLGTGRIAGAVAGAALALAPWRLAQAGHLHVMSSGGIMLALAMLARGHGYSLRHGYRPERRHAGWALAGWLVAAWQLSLGFGIGLPFAYALLLIVLVSLVTYLVKRFWVWTEPKPFGWRLLAADAGGGLIFGAVGALLAIPYFRVSELYPYAKRSIEEIQLYSPPLQSFFTASGESAVWGTLHAQAREALPWAPEMTLLPGFALIGLATAGLFFSIWTVRQRLLMLAGVLVTGALAMGTEFFGGTFTYVPLFEYLPGWQGIRTPGRLVLWTTIFLALLAAGAVAAYSRRAVDFSRDQVPARPGLLLRVVTLLPLVAILLEGTNATPHPLVPQQPLAMRTVDGPMLVLPSEGGWDQHVMLWSTTRFQQVTNGGSGFTPQLTEQIRQSSATFPDQPSVDYLRGVGVKTVVVLRDRIGGTDLETRIDLPVDYLGITREDIENAVVFRL